MVRRRIRLQRPAALVALLTTLGAATLPGAGIAIATGQMPDGQTCSLAQSAGSLQPNRPAQFTLACTEPIDAYRVDVYGPRGSLANTASNDSGYFVFTFPDDNKYTLIAHVAWGGADLKLRLSMTVRPGLPSNQGPPSNVWAGSWIDASGRETMTLTDLPLGGTLAGMLDGTLGDCRENGTHLICSFNAKATNDDGSWAQESGTLDLAVKTASTLNGTLKMSSLVMHAKDGTTQRGDLAPPLSIAWRRN